MIQMFPVFDSRSSDCRMPTGAVASGTVVRFRAYPESERFPLRGYLVVEFEAEGRITELEMTHFPPMDGREVFEAELDVGDYVGLCFYHFRFENDGGCFRYGARAGHTGGVCQFYGGEQARPYQLTVYKPRSVPDWFGQGVTYQIFPDRFARKGEPLTINTQLCDGTTMQSRRRLAMRWGDSPNPHPEQFDGRMEVTNREFFGGNLAGIIDKLDYLQELGVTTLYLNPIFESFSNHRYDTGDYEKIDPVLGDEDDFRALCSEAHRRGMRVLLDGVFNHTGSDSRYFNRRGTYPTVGAYQSEESPYYSWFCFDEFPNRYSSWWGIDTLPAVNEGEPSYRRFICGNVVQRWLDAGADGWRLDVADELPDDFIREISAAARARKPDAFIVGEVWEDASNKISYSVRRRYLLDGGLDAVMGYVFRTALLRLLESGDCSAFREDMLDMLENYPPYAVKNSMNILGTHDTPRILTLLGTEADAFAGPKENHGGVHSSPALRPRAVKLLKIASAIQFCFVGSPTIYYGDEAGAEGAEDPFCRRTFPWGHEDPEILDWYKTLGGARRELAALSRGNVVFDGTNGCTMVMRRTLGRKGSAIDERQAPNGANFAAENDVVLVANLSQSLQTANVPRGTFRDLVTGETVVVGDEMFHVEHFASSSDGRSPTGTGEVTLEPLSVRILVKL